MIPQNIKSEHILKAIEEVEKSGIPRERNSDRYDLEYNKKIYPPKYIISLANKYANGKELDHSEFSGGDEANNFLESLGFNIVNKQNDVDEGALEDQAHDWAPRLKDYLENTYSIKIDKSSGRSNLSFPSGIIVHVHGSKIIKDGRRPGGFSFLQEGHYRDIVDNTNKFFAVVFGGPENTFVFPKEALRIFFEGQRLSTDLTKGKKPMWYFHIREANDKHYLKLSSPPEAKEVYIENYLNKWDQIEDFKLLYGRTNTEGYSNYWVLIVMDQSEQNLTAQQILVTRINDKFWGLNDRTSNRALLKKGDKVIFSHGARSFLGTATLDSESFELTNAQKNQYSHGNDFFRTNFGVKLKDTELWKDPKPVKQYAEVLSFIKKKEQYPAYFQGGIRKISKEDYNNILNISPSQNLLSFIDLQKFLLDEMQMQANYQPIMIRTLLQSGGKATKDDIAAKIKELNSEKEDQDFKNVPVYDVLEKHGIVTKYGNEFVLNSEELTAEQSRQLIALCNWKTLAQPLPLEELIEAFDKNKSLFDPDRITLEESERLRSSFVSDFPIDKIQAMKLDEYVPGKPDPRSGQVDKTTFCYRLERGLPGQGGIQGVVAQKFGIFFNREEQVYKYNKEKYDSPEKAFDAIKSEIYSILQAGKQFKEDKNWEILSEVVEYNDYDIYRLVRSKILSVYYPEHFIQIHSLNHLQHILEIFGKSTIDIKDKLFLTQARLLEVKDEHPIMKQWLNKDFSHFLWHAIIQRNSASTKKLSVWVVRAGSTGEQENDALKKNIVTIAWNQLPDLSHIDDRQSIKQLYFRSDPNAKEMAVSNMVGSIWRFVNEIKKGDLVVLPLLSQDSKTIAIGRVEGDYEYKELTPDIKHVRPVKWLAKNILKSEFDEDTIKHLQIPMTVFQIKNDNAIKGIVKVLQKYGVSDIDIDRDRFDVIESESTRKRENTTVSKLELRSWQSLTKHEIDDMVYTVLQGDNQEGNRLAIPPEIVKRITYHLISSKHVILLGPPGTGKTDLAIRLLHELGTRIIGIRDPIEAVASYEWGRYDVIGGNSLIANTTANKFSFHYGCVTKAIKDNKFLLIDEFNRADMNKAFGEMFLAIDHGIIQLREDEIPDELPLPVVIPSHFRMICTMNDYDKSLLNDLSYGLLRRFAFVEIRIPNDREELKSVIKQRVINDLSRSNSFLKTELYNILEEVDVHITKLIDLIYAIRNNRELGVSTLIDIIRYIASRNLIEKESNNWKLLNEALIDYILPQLDRLDINTLRMVQSAATNHLKYENGNTVTETEEFNQMLNHMILKLQVMAELLK